MEEFNIEHLLEEPILREKQFREILRNIDWEQYRNQKVVIKGCSQIEIPTWAYLLAMSYLMKVAKSISYGEPCAAIPVFIRKES
ncbi:MAG: DUF2480 family protein [Calditrichaeota bacterium]|nr:MAG: DUF2480 family protein [Calditrichota bacterium]